MLHDVVIEHEFKEVSTSTEAEVRIGFLRGDGAWSYVGRDVLGIGTAERTMNFGWDLTQPGEIDTALHEIGHTIGFPHEHQNPHAGIVWDEEAVYAALAQPPNEWDRDKPAQYFQDGLRPMGGLSERDEQWVKTFYPTLTKNDYEKLEVGRSAALDLRPSGQKNFTIEPAATRYYEIGTFGKSDTVMVLFEKVGNTYRYMTADDDSGQDFNSKLRVKLMRGRSYLLRVRLYYSSEAGQTCVMLW